MPGYYYILVSLALFFIGTAGALIRRNALFVLMGLELQLGAGSLALLTFARGLGDQKGHVVAFFVMARAIVHSKYGRVLQAIRDAESRVMFTGYDPVAYKISIFTLSAVMCGVAGALYVPQVGIINPGEMSPAASIEIAIWAAVGGRATLIGPIVGAFFVNGAKSWFTVAFPEFWLFFLGALFIAVTLFLPDGVVGLLKRKKENRS